MLRLLIIVLLFLSNYTIGQQAGYKFIENKNQWPEKVSYKADIQSGFLYLEKDGFLFNLYDGNHFNKYIKAHYDKLTQYDQKDLEWHAYKVNFENCNQNPIISGTNKTQEYYNYFLGNDQSKWGSKAYGYHRVKYENLYNNIDLCLYTKFFNLKYDIIVHPGGNTNDIALTYKGADNVAIKNERLHIYTQVNHIIEDKPKCYQIINGESVQVACNYVLNNKTLSFDFPDGYDKSIDLIIDPTLIFSTYSGSFSNNFGYTATFDSKGFLYAGSSAFGNQYPTTTGAYNTSWNSGIVDIAITKYDTTGTFRIYSTYLGGDNDELPHSLIANSFDELFIFGTTSSTNFPYTTNCYDSTYNGGVGNQMNGLGVNYSNGSDIIVSQLSTDGSSLLASTYIGGTGNDGLNSTSIVNSQNILRYNYADEVRGEIDIDENNNVYVVTCTQSSDFPIVGNVFQPTYGGGPLDGCIIKLDNALENIIWSSYLGAEKHDAIYSLSIDSEDDIYVTGGTESDSLNVSPNAIDTNFIGGRSDGFISHISEDGTQVINCTYYGSSEYDQSYFIELDRNDNVYVYGQSEVMDSTFIKNVLWSVPGSGQFVSKISPELDTILYSTVFGAGNGINISPTAFLVDLCNKMYFSGWGGGTNNITSILDNNAGYTFNMPITPDAYQSTTDGSDFYLMVLEDDGSGIVYGSYFGGAQAEEHVDGGTSRFDRKGKVYQSACAGCYYGAGSPPGYSDFPIEPVNAVSPTNNANCNNAVFKMDFNLPVVLADFDIPPIGCEPYTYTFINTSLYQNNTSFYWDFGDNNTSTAFNPTHTYTTAGNYQITLILQDTATCNLGDTIVRDITILGDTSYQLNDVNICPGGIEQIGLLPNPNPSITYSWSPSTGLSDTAISNPFADPTTTTNYTLLISNGICVDTVSQQVIMNTPLLSLPGDTTLCSDTNVLAITANSFGTSNTYIWSTDTLFTDTINSPISNPTINVSPDSNITYYVQISNNGCELYDSIQVYLADASTQISSDAIICLYDSAQLLIWNMIPGDSLIYDWGPDSIILSDDANDTIWVNPSVSTMAYVNSFSTITGCNLVDSVFITVDQLPNLTVTATADHDTIPEGGTTNLHASPNGYNYTWTPSTGLSDPNSQHPECTLTETTTFYLTVENNGCAKSDSITIYVTEVVCGPPDIFLPNAFTPNSDNANDLLRVRGNNIVEEEFVFRIFDRWGNLLFETFDFNKGWDGTYNGKPCDPGVYVYYFEALCIDNETYFKKGNITLIK